MKEKTKKVIYAIKNLFALFFAGAGINAIIRPADKSYFIAGIFCIVIGLCLYIFPRKKKE